MTKDRDRGTADEPLRAAVEQAIDERLAELYLAEAARLREQVDDLKTWINGLQAQIEGQQSAMGQTLKLGNAAEERAKSLEKKVHALVEIIRRRKDAAELSEALEILGHAPAVR